MTALEEGSGASQVPGAEPRKRWWRRGKPASTTGRKRWPRRVAIGSGIAVLLIGVLVVSGLVYARIRYDEIAKLTVKHLTPQPASGPFDILLVGSDSRQFVDGSQQAKEFGSASSVTGERSDVIIVARFDPATHKVLMLSIPRDTVVDIPGQGQNRINSAFNNGPSLLVQTIQKDFGIPVNHFVEVNFAGFSGIVDSLGGIYLDFSTPVKDKMSGLDITKKGCQLLNGSQALSLVRSRDEYYLASDGSWNYDGMGDWSRIRRQDAFFRSVISRVHSSFDNPITLNSFLGSAVHDATIDNTLSETDLFDLATQFHGVGQQSLTTEVLPTTPEVVNGADLLLPAQPFAQQMIAKFLAFGKTPAGGPAKTPPSSTASTSTTTTTAPPSSASNVVFDNPKTLPEPWDPTTCTP